MSEEKIIILKGAERVRRRPSVIFGSDNEYGALHALIYLLELIVDEAKLGFCNYISLTIHNDNSITIKANDRGLIIDEEMYDDKPGWYYDFCELQHPAYNKDEPYSINFGKKHFDLYGEVENTPKYFEEHSQGFDLCCVQYVTEYMNVQVIRDGMKKNLSFVKGSCSSQLCIESSDQKTETRFNFKLDNEVFSKIDIPLSDVEKWIKERAITLKAVCFDISDERTSYRNSFCFINGVLDYAQSSQMNATELYVKTNETTGKDRYNRPEYNAYVRLLLGFTNDDSLIECYHNNRKLEYGGHHLIAAKEKIVKQLNWHFLRYLSSNKNSSQKEGNSLFKKKEISFDEISNNLILIIESYSTATSFENATKKAITNAMIKDMTSDLINDDFGNYLEKNHDIVLSLLRKNRV